MKGTPTHRPRQPTPRTARVVPGNEDLFPDAGAENSLMDRVLLRARNLNELPNMLMRDPTSTASNTPTINRPVITSGASTQTYEFRATVKVMH